MKSSTVFGILVYLVLMALSHVAGAALSSGPELTLRVNLKKEEATITNVGDREVNLRGWTLVSVKGNQRFTFDSDIRLQAHQSVVVTSGRKAKHQPPAFVRWTTRYIWRNKGDPGQLLDPNGEMKAESR